MNKVAAFFLFLFLLAGFSSAQNFTVHGRIHLPSTFWPTTGDTTGGSDCWGWTSPAGEDYAFMGTTYGTYVVRASDMAVIDSVEGPKLNDYYYHRDYKTYRNYLYAVCEMTGVNQGIQIIDLSYLPDSVHLVKTYVTGNEITSHNLTIDTANAYMYVMKSNYTGFRVIDISDPVNPVDVNVVLTPDIHDVYARNDTVWVAEGTNKTYSVYDLSNKANPTLMTRVTTPTSGYAHNIWPSDDGRYFLTTEETNFKTVKVWEWTPGNIPQYSADYLGACSLAHNVQVMGDYVFISHYESGITVIDISNPLSPVEVAKYDTYPAGETHEFHGCWGAFPYTENGYVYASDIEGYLTVLNWNAQVSRDDEAFASGIKTYPEPFSDALTLEFLPDHPAGEWHLQVFDLQGKLVKELHPEPSAGKYRLELAGLPAGKYVLRLQAGAEVAVKFVTKGE